MPDGWRPSASTQGSDKATSNPDPATKNQGLGSLDSFRPEVPRRSFEDLVVTDPVRSRIRSALNRIVHHNTLYKTWNLESIDPDRSGIAINLFGPPGTGKTFCAEAIAHRLERPLIRVNYAEIESKYVGETPKNITAAFQKAEEHTAVLFFDESDSILGKRLTNITQSADHSVNVSRAVMLTQLDRFSGIVIFATNLARNYDGAFVRRILAHIEFELPDEECRRKLWDYLIPDRLPIAEDVGSQELARQSDGLAGGDILNVVISAASRAVERSGAACQVELRDLQQGIEEVREAKWKIGTQAEGDDRNRLSTQEEVVQPQDLPADVHDQYQQVIDREMTTQPLDE